MIIIVVIVIIITEIKINFRGQLRGKNVILDNVTTIASIAQIL